MCLYIFNFHLLNSCNGRKKLLLQRDLRGALSLKLSTICPNCLSLKFSGPSRHIRIKRSTLFSLSIVHNGDTSKFITESARSTPEVDGGNCEASLY